MTDAAAPSDGRVLVHAPRGRDAEVVTAVLRGQRMAVDVCDTFARLIDEIGRGAGVAFLTEESLGPNEVVGLARWIDDQPPWSDFPFVVLVPRHAGRRTAGAARTLERLGNVVLLERPLGTETLLSAARAALRGRARQYQARRHLAQQQEAREAERAARAEELRAKETLALALDAADLGTFHCPWPLGRLEWNEACKAQFWLPPDAEVDIGLFYRLIHDDDREAVRTAIDAAFDADQPYDIEYRTVSATGRYRWIRAKGRVYRDVRGTPMRFDGVTIDITRQKQLEGEREFLLAAEREARGAAERASRMKDEFLATLSHELRTPLSAILGWTHLLARQPAGRVDVAKAVATIERNARAQAKLIEDLLDVSRIAAGKLRLEPGPVAIAALVDAVVASLRPTAESNGVTLETRPFDPQVEITADAARLQQAVWNLVSNAVKFSAPHGHVVVALRTERGWLELSVSDDGAGIDPGFLPHVFDRFRQADASAARAQGGLGLGLAIVRSMVELHGGSVHARSDGPGRGATFTIRIPFAPPGARSPGAGKTEVAAAQGGGLDGRRILVVDDELDGRDMLVLVLESWGARVTAAASAEEALAVLRRMRVDLVVSDIGMPHVDGYELIRRVRRFDDARAARLPAIALTAFARAEDVAKALEAGYQRHLAKPVDPTLLRSTVERLLDETPTSADAPAA
ncbi:MAG TPA: ATP-binding protein [Caldimonas sp.]|nr:ATP-binding protein [Caldimonas sp.]